MDVCMKIDFSDYKSLTQKDIIKIDCEFTGGFENRR